MRRSGAAVMVLVAAALLCGPARAARAAGGDGPACLRARIGSTGACLTLSWYLGLRKAVEERDVEVGLRLTLSRAPRAAAVAARSVPGQPEDVLRRGAPPAGGLVNGAQALVGALAAYGVLEPGGGLQRFVREGGE